VTWRPTRRSSRRPRWPAASLAHADQEALATVAVTVDLSVGFHRPADDEWLLAEATAPLATGGLVAASGRVWDRAGALVASGGQTMMCRPALTA
jgi:acyl-CoA thioesterase